MRILNSDSNIRLSLKSANFFTAEKDGVTSTYDIPQATRSFYTTLTMQALSRLIIRGGYTRMNDTQKTAIVQRVINYYWNHMRNYVINEDGKAKIASSSGLSDVIQRAIDYEKR
jgi:primase-polymerase (primpol)-like protein